MKKLLLLLLLGISAFSFSQRNGSYFKHGIRLGTQTQPTNTRDGRIWWDGDDLYIWENSSSQWLPITNQSSSGLIDGVNTVTSDPFGFYRESGQNGAILSTTGAHINNDFKLILGQYGYGTTPTIELDQATGRTIFTVDGGNGVGFVLDDTAYTANYFTSYITLDPNASSLSDIQSAPNNALATKEWVSDEIMNASSGGSLSAGNGLNIDINGNLALGSSLMSEGVDFNISASNSSTLFNIVVDDGNENSTTSFNSEGSELISNSGNFIGTFTNKFGNVTIKSENSSSLLEKTLSITPNEISAPFLEISDINAASQYSLVTKDWVLNQSSSGGSSTGLESIDEGNGNGWRLTGQDNTFYGNIGSQAVDLSISSGASTTRGATGSRSVAFGFNSIASGPFSFAFGQNATASSFDSFAFGLSATASQSSAIAIGITATATANASIAIGESDATANNAVAIGQNALAAGQRSVAFQENTSNGSWSASFGRGNTSQSAYEFSIGMFSTNYTATATNTDRLFNVGNGTNNSNRSNAFTIFKNGSVVLYPVAKSSITNPQAGTLIIDSSDGNAIKLYDGTGWRELTSVAD